MEYGQVPGINKPVSRLAQGCIMVDTKNLDYSFSLLDAVFEMGCNTFDTAHIYGGGACERGLGAWIRDRAVRENVIILTKGAHHNSDRRRVTPFDITSDLHDSLARLKTDYVDLYLLHRDDPTVPVGPIVEVLNEHYRAGKIRAFGGSNWTHQRIAEANAYARARGLVPFAASSPQYSLVEQIEEPWENCISIGGPSGEEARAWYAQERLAVFSWSSLGRGFLSGRHTRQTLESLPKEGSELCVRCFRSEDNLKRLDRAHELARMKSVTVPHIGLAYIFAQPLNLFALVGCEKPEEFRANLEALALRLTKHECDWLDLKSDTL